MLEATMEQRTRTWSLILLLGVTPAAWASEARDAADLHSDTWVATDALGRALPGFGQCGPPRSDRTVGIFYFLWLGQHGQQGPFDITRLLASDSNDPHWGPAGAFHHWGQPELGYYLSDSDYVIRRHASMLSDAGVDTLIFDVTNAFTYPRVYLKLCAAYEDLRRQGLRTPQICFLAHSNCKATIETLYAEFYAKGLYRDLWFLWKGKPLILGDPEGLSPEVLDFFTLRRCWAWTHGKDTWQWLDHTESRYGWHESPDKPEELAVSVAEHPVSNIGRSYSHGRQPAPDRHGLTGQEHQGLYFAEQWERALRIDPEFVFVTGWNEWVAQRFIEQAGQAPDAMPGRALKPGDTFFVDAFTQEYSRDIEPMKGGHTDNYYYQMVSSIRRYKGVRPREAATRDYPIRIDGEFDDWVDVRPEFRDTPGDILHRKEPGWGSAGPYVDQTGRNDFVTLKVAADANRVCFYAQTREPTSPCTDPNWMLLWIDVDQDPKTGWFGYDLLVNQTVAAATTAVKSYQNGRWITVADAPYKVSASQLELAIPRSLFRGSEAVLRFDFHWADNIQSTDDVLEFALHGDSAPNRRFNYRFERR
jgi:hypothetical protein